MEKKSEDTESRQDETFIMKITIHEAMVRKSYLNYRIKGKAVKALALDDIHPTVQQPINLSKLSFALFGKVVF